MNAYRTTEVTTPLYSPARVFLHWLSASVILWTLVTGFAASFCIKNTPFRNVIDLVNPQVTTLLIPFFLVRTGLYLKSQPWRSWNGLALGERFASLAHAALYAVILAVLATGVLMMPAPWKLLGLLPMPLFFHGQAALTMLFFVHLGVCIVLLALVCLHLAAVAWHIGMGHAILRRMSFEGEREWGR